MLRPRARDRAGFQFIELVILIAVIFIVIAMILPLMQRPRSPGGGGMRCMSNMRNVAQALLIYEMTHRRYPGYANVLLMDDGRSYIDPQTGDPRGVSYIVPLLPYLDQPALDRAWRDPAAHAEKFDPKVELKLLVCPEDPPTLAGGAPLSYVVNCGIADVAGAEATATTPGIPRDWAANGVFFDLYTGNPLVAGVPPPKPGETVTQGSAIPRERLAKGPLSDKVGIFAEKQSGVPLVGMSNDYISRHDGTALTIMLSENVDAGEYTDFTEAKVGIVWDATGKLDPTTDPPTLKPPDDNMRIDVGTGMNEFQKPGSDTTIFARPSSWHGRGVNMAFCDGRVRFVSDQMDYYVYCLLMSSNGAAVRLPGSDKVLPDFDRPPVESWFLH